MRGFLFLCYDLRMRLKPIIKLVCDELHIEAPSLSFDVSVFDTETQMAALDVKKNIMHLRSEDVTPDNVFAVCHELRHSWQRQHRLVLLLGHKTRNELSVEEYNKQPAEVDANAYAALFCEAVFNMRPLFNGLSDEVKELIAARCKEIEYGDT